MSKGRGAAAEERGQWCKSVTTCSASGEKGGDGGAMRGVYEDRSVGVMGMRLLGDGGASSLKSVFKAAKDVWKLPGIQTHRTAYTQKSLLCFYCNIKGRRIDDVVDYNNNNNKNNNNSNINHIKNNNNNNNNNNNS